MELAVSDRVSEATKSSGSSSGKIVWVRRGDSNSDSDVDGGNSGAELVSMSVSVLLKLRKETRG